jgi:hypothetical protein
MKKLTLLTILLMFSPFCWGEWVLFSKNVDDTSSYVDLDRIRQHDGYVYFWKMDDYLTPTENGIMSGKVYSQGDCGVFRFKNLSLSFYKEPMGEGTPEQLNSTDTPWKYPSPDSSSETILKTVCDSVKTR